VYSVEFSVLGVTSCELQVTGFGLLELLEFVELLGLIGLLESQ